MFHGKLKILTIRWWSLPNRIAIGVFETPVYLWRCPTDVNLLDQRANWREPGG